MYVPLRVTSAHSVGAGTIRAEDLASFCAGNGIPAAGIADRDSLAGTMATAKVLRAKGVQPLTGTTLRLRSGACEGDVVLYATGPAGWAGLLRVANAWNIPEPALRRAPGLDELGALLGDGASEILVLTGGPDGLIEKLLVANLAAARKALADLAALFPSRVYVEIQRGFEGADRNAVEISQLADALALPLLGTCPATHRSAEMLEAHEAYLCITGKAYLASDDRPRAVAGQPLLSPAAMAELFADMPEALENSVEFARRAVFMPEPAPARLPSFPCHEGEDEAACCAGWPSRGSCVASKPSGPGARRPIPRPTAPGSPTGSTPSCGWALPATS